MEGMQDILDEVGDEVGELASNIFNQSNFTKTGTSSKASSSSSSSSSVSHTLVKDNVIGTGIGKKSGVGVGFPASASPTVIFLISVGLVLAVGFIIFLYALRKKYNMVKYKSPREIQMSQGEEADGDGDGEDSTLHFMRLKNSASPPLSQGYPESMANPNFNPSSGANFNANSNVSEREGGGITNANANAQESESDLFFDHPTARGTFMKIHFQNSDSKYKILEEM